MYTVDLIREGFCRNTEDGNVQRKCNTVLIRGPIGMIVVNPGSPWDESSLRDNLHRVGVADPSNDIKYVICTDGRAEFVGCMSLFKGAELIIVGNDIQKRGDIFLDHDFGDYTVPFEFDEQISVLGTPGHRAEQVTVLVHGVLSDNSVSAIPTQTPKTISVIAITGGFFTEETDVAKAHVVDHGTSSKVNLSRESTTSSFTGNTAYGGPDESGEQNSLEREGAVRRLSRWRQSRDQILERANWIIPSYGKAFEVQPEFSNTPCVELA